MKTFIVSCGAIFFIVNLYAQYTCDQEELYRRPGKFKESKAKGSLYNVTTKEVTAESVVLNQIDQMIKTGYHPVGIVATVVKTYGYIPASGTNWIGNPFYYYLPLQKYLYSKGIEYVNGEAVVDVVASLFVYANRMEWIANISASGLEAKNKNGYVQLRDMPVEKDGIFYFDLNPGTTEYFEAVLITKNGKLPYQYVTRKEFLEIRKNQLEKKRSEALDATIKRNNVRSATEQEAAKQKEIADLKRDNYSQPYIDRFLKDYKTDEQKRDADITRSNKYFDTPIELIKQLLTNYSDKELSEPAIILGQDEYDTFTGFVADAKGICLVKPNPEYFNKKLPKTSPQFFVVFYRWVENDPVYKNAMAEIKKSINYSTLKNMLGK
jgi:hypothetical protein